MQCTLLNWQAQKWAFLQGFLCRKSVLACSRSGLFNFRFLFALANCLEVTKLDFRDDCLNFLLFIKNGVNYLIFPQSSERVSTWVTPKRVTMPTQTCTPKIYLHPPNTHPHSPIKIVHPPRRRKIYLQPQCYGKVVFKF